MASVISSQNGRPRRSSTGQFEQPRAKWLDEDGSKRWNLFRSALILAIERVASRWTYKDFEMCFPLMCEEKLGEAEDTFRDIQVLMKTLMEQNLTGVFKKYELIERMNELDHIIREARDRAASGEAYMGADKWRPDIPPRQAARARTVPVLEAERDRLLAELAELEEEALAKQEQIRANVKAKEAAQAETTLVLDAFDEVADAWNAATEEWTEVDQETSH